MQDEIEKKIQEEMGGKKTLPSTSKKERAIEEAGLNDPNIGWKPIPKDTLNSKGLFYPKNTSIRVKPLNFEGIKTYSLIDEEDKESIENGINSVLANSAKFSGGDWRDFTVADKLQLFFSIRDWTMQNTESKNEVTMKFVSRSNPKMTKVLDVNAKMFDYHTIDEGLMKWYDSSERCFTIEDSELKNPIKIYAPTVGTINKIKQYVDSVQMEMRYNTEISLDKTFAVYSQYMVDDWRKIDDEFEYLKTLKKQFDSMSPDELQIFDHAVNLLKMGIKPTIKVTFDDGNVEMFPMTFRKYKSLFFVSNKIGRLFGTD